MSKEVTNYVSCSECHKYVAEDKIDRILLDGQEVLLCQTCKEKLDAGEMSKPMIPIPCPTVPIPDPWPWPYHRYDPPRWIENPPKLPFPAPIVWCNTYCKLDGG